MSERANVDKEKRIGHRRIDEEGELTYKKISSKHIIGSIQMGIQYAIGGVASKPERDLLVHDFMTVETKVFTSDGANDTPAHDYPRFTFKIYAPIAFRYFRDLFGIQSEDFMLSFCRAPLRELPNPGASGSIFYVTSDDEFIMKTVTRKEAEFLQKLLPGYYMNLVQNPRTLLPKFFGLYCYHCNTKNIRLVVTNNLFPSSVTICEKYDLKGSTYKRKASSTECQKRLPTYKDLDFKNIHPSGLSLEAETYDALVKTLHRDCRVLQSFRIMDYSLLIGVHLLSKEELQAALAKNDSALQELTPSTSNGITRYIKPALEDTLVRSKSRRKILFHSAVMDSIDSKRKNISELGGIPAKNEKGEDILLFTGIIDILQSYELKKKLEHTFKSVFQDGDQVSVHRPDFYSDRFLNFMTGFVFKKIPEESESIDGVISPKMTNVGSKMSRKSSTRESKRNVRPEPKSIPLDTTV